LEKFHKNGIGLVTASGIGFITLIIAHQLALEGDTMEMMRAVLDTNFWLATHVVAVTVVTRARLSQDFWVSFYIVLGVFTTNLTRPMTKNEASVVGTVGALIVKGQLDYSGKRIY